jgi:hypothetical protein
MTKVKAGFFSFVEVTDPAAHQAYNEWHQLDHLPEQLPIPGIVHGQRWVMTPACRRAGAVVTAPVDRIHYMALYLVAEPVQPTLDHFEEVGHRLGELGRFHRERRSHLFGAWHLLETWAAPRVLISPEAVPYRPGTGVYVIVEEVVDAIGLPVWLQGIHRAGVPALGATDGVVGVWSFATTPLYANPRWVTGGARITVCWLDRDPVTVAGALDGVVRRRWDDAPVRPLLSAPMETIAPWAWSWFDDDQANVTAP